MREWSIGLSAIQRLALMFVFDRTLGWGKEWEYITLDHCTKGIVAEDGTVYAAPFTSNKQTARKALTELEAMGYLRVQESPIVGRPKRYSLNFNQVEAYMRVPKRLKNKITGDSEKGTGSAESDTNITQSGVQKWSAEGFISEPPLGCKSGLQRDILRIYKKKPKGKTKISDAEPAPQVSEKENLERAVIKVQTFAKSRLSEKKMKGGRNCRKDGTGFLPKQSNVALFWRELWTEHFPDTPLEAMPLVSQKILWQYWRSWTESRGTGEFLEYLTWIFENWNALRLGSFSWMTNFPKAPSVRLVTSAKLRHVFEEAYKAREAIALWRKLEPHERKLRELVENGMDPDKAREVVEREYSTAKELKKISEARQKLHIAMETANRRQSRTPNGASRRRGPLKMEDHDFGQWKDDE